MSYFPLVLKNRYMEKTSKLKRLKRVFSVPCRSTWAWGHEVWWKWEPGCGAHTILEQLWHFILLWKWCNAGRPLLSPQADQVPERAWATLSAFWSHVNQRNEDVRLDHTRGSVATKIPQSRFEIGSRSSGTRCFPDSIFGKQVNLQCTSFLQSIIHPWKRYTEIMGNSWWIT